MLNRNIKQESILIMDVQSKGTEQEAWKVLESAATNDSLAKIFPAWDLSPPSQLIKRRTKKFI